MNIFGKSPRQSQVPPKQICFDSPKFSAKVLHDTVFIGGKRAALSPLPPRARPFITFLRMGPAAFRGLSGRARGNSSPTVAR